MRILICAYGIRKYFLCRSLYRGLLQTCGGDSHSNLQFLRAFFLRLPRCRSQNTKPVQLLQRSHVLEPSHSWQILPSISMPRVWRIHPDDLICLFHICSLVGSMVFFPLFSSRQTEKVMEKAKIWWKLEKNKALIVSKRLKIDCHRKWKSMLIKMGSAKCSSRMCDDNAEDRQFGYNEKRTLKNEN